jgi:tRNA A37 threonylcarbamoyladenosine modification protein TsaB
MLTLIINTASAKPIVIISDGKQLVIEHNILVSKEKHIGNQLLRSIEDILKKQHLSLQQIGRIAAHPGPGNFSSLRLGIITATMLAQAINSELVSCTGDNTSELIASAADALPTNTIKPNYGKKA